MIKYSDTEMVCRSCRERNVLEVVHIEVVRSIEPYDRRLALRVVEEVHLICPILQVDDVLPVQSILRGNPACNRFVCLLPCGAVFRNSTYVYMVKNSFRMKRLEKEREPTRMPAPRDTGFDTNLGHMGL